MTPTIKLFGMLLGLAVLAGCPDQSVTSPPSWQYPVAPYEESRPLAQTFADLAALIEERHPSLQMGLNPPATKKQLDAFEELIGHRLPDDFRQLYRLADGQKPGTAPLFPEGYDFLSLEVISQEWAAMKEIYENKRFFWESDTPQGVVKNRSWHTAWIPFAQAITGDYYCIDLDPAPGGQIGQVIEFSHEDTVTPHLGFSLNDYLGHYEHRLRDGMYVYHDAWGAFVSGEEK